MRIYAQTELGSDIGAVMNRAFGGMLDAGDATTNTEGPHGS